MQTLKPAFKCAGVAVLVIMGAMQLQAQRTTPEEYINNFKEAAVREMARTGVPAAITLAQGIHEADAGNSDLVKRSNNHFGIKCKSTWTGGKVYHDDDARGECFRKYDSAEESYRDHSDFLKSNTRYAFLFELDPADYASWARGLKKAGYATNPRYAQILISIVEKYSLNDYTMMALQQMGKATPEGYVFRTAPAPAKTETPAVSETAGVTAAPQPAYPEGVFRINETKVVYAKAGASLLAIAENNGIDLSKLLDFNDMDKNSGDILEEDALVYLQRKRKQGAVDFHTVQPGEDLYAICQKQGVRYDSLMELNQLDEDAIPAPGEKIFLRSKAPVKPKLLSK